MNPKQESEPQPTECNRCWTWSGPRPWVEPDACEKCKSNREWLKRELAGAAEDVSNGARRDESTADSRAFALVEMARLINEVCVAYFEMTEYDRETRGGCDTDKRIEEIHAMSFEAIG